MKKKLFILVLVLALLAQLSFAQVNNVYAATEFLLNGGAEEGDSMPDNWAYDLSLGVGISDWDDSVFHSGSRSLKFTQEEVGTLSMWYQNLTNLEPTKEYVLSGWIKTEGVEGHDFGAQFGAQVYTGEAPSYVNTGAEYIDAVLGDTDWKYEEVRFTIPEDNTITSICLRMWGAKGTVWFDDLSIKEVTEEPTPEAPTEGDPGEESPSNPKTGDLGVVFFMLTAASSSMFIFKKKHK